MNSADRYKVQTNELTYSLNREALKERYDLFRINVSLNRLPSYSSLFDSPLANNSVCSVVYNPYTDGCKSLYVLTHKGSVSREDLSLCMRSFDRIYIPSLNENVKRGNSDNKTAGSEVNEILKGEEESRKSFSVDKCSFEVIPDDLLLNLLLFSLSSFESERFRSNNIGGHFYCLSPNLMSSDKKQIIALELYIRSASAYSDSCKLIMNVRTFTKVSAFLQKNHADDFGEDSDSTSSSGVPLKEGVSSKESSGNEDSKKGIRNKLYSLPQYVMESTFKMRRKLKGDNADGYIIKQFKGKKSFIPFLGLAAKGNASSKKFTSSKVGIVLSAFDEFNKRFSGIASIGFKSYDNWYSCDPKYLASGEWSADDLIRRTKQCIVKYKVCVVDDVNSHYSHELNEALTDVLAASFGVSAFSSLSPRSDCLNIRIIHNQEYYKERGINDIYRDSFAGTVIQHITVEDFPAESPKKDSGTVEGLIVKESVVLNIVNELLIKQDLKTGSFSLFDWGRFGLRGPCSFWVRHVVDWENKVFKFFKMSVADRGSFSVEEKFVLKESAFFPLVDSETQEISEIFGLYDNRRKSDRALMVICFANGDVNVISGTDLFTFPSSELLTFFREADKKSSGEKGITKGLKDSSHVYMYFNSLLDLKFIEKNDCVLYYSGILKSQLSLSVPRAALIRRITGYGGSPVRFNEISPLLNVLFVRNDQLTVLPFPAKYITEYINSPDKDQAYGM